MDYELSEEVQVRLRMRKRYVSSPSIFLDVVGVVTVVQEEKYVLR